MGSRCGRTGTGSRVGGRRDSRWAGSAPGLETQRALQNQLSRLGPRGRAATITLAECVEEYLQTHTGERVTIAKLRWLLRSAGRCRSDPAAYANGRVKQTKTRLSRCAVPLQASAFEALDQLPSRHDSRLLFPNSRGGHLDFRNFNRRRWKPVQQALGSNPLRDLYDLHHTYATFALRAPVSRCSPSRGSWARASR
jgi:hypothetical protein